MTAHSEWRRWRDTGHAVDPEAYEAAKAELMSTIVAYRSARTAIDIAINELTGIRHGHAGRILTDTQKARMTKAINALTKLREFIGNDDD